MNREHQNGSQTGVAGALSALKLLLGAAAGLLKRGRGAIRDRPTGICKTEYRSAEPAAGLEETRGTREPRGQQRRMDQHKERDMDKAGKMSEIDMQTASGLKDARNHRNATADAVQCLGPPRREFAVRVRRAGDRPAGSRADRHHPHQQYRPGESLRS